MRPSIIVPPNLIRNPKTPVWVWLVVLVSSGVSLGAAQQSAPRQIIRVDFAGLDQVPVGVAQNTAGIRPGDPFDTKVLDEAIGRLARSGRFSAVTYSIDDTGSGVAVTFKLRERTIVAAVMFEGNTKFNASELSKQVVQQVGEPLDILGVRDGAEAIRSMYREAGYPSVDVLYDKSRLETSREVVYVITEGNQVRIHEITFDGATAYTAKQLLKQVETKTAWWVFRSGAFDENRVQADVLSLQKFYRDEGFLDAKVGFRATLNEETHQMALVFEVEEGTKYRIESVTFTGQTVFSSEELTAMVGSKVGDTVLRPQVSEDAQTIQTRYGSLGYIYARVRPVRVFAN